jgi:hypothetical protein
MEKFTYAQVETALAKFFGMPAEVQAGMFRARLVHLRRLGFAPQGEGRGTRIEYERDDVLRWLFALKLQDVGIAPQIAAQVVDRTWRSQKAAGLQSLVKIVAMADATKHETTVTRGDILIVIDYPVLRAAWDPSVTPIISHLVSPNDLGKLLQWLSDDRHACIFNLSAFLRILHRELPLSQTEKPDGNRKKIRKARRAN